MSTCNLVASLVVVRSGQRVFVDVVREQLKRIEFATDGYATLIHVPGLDRGRVQHPYPVTHHTTRAGHGPGVIKEPSRTIRPTKPVSDINQDR